MQPATSSSSKSQHRWTLGSEDVTQALSLSSGFRPSVQSRPSIDLDSSHVASAQLVSALTESARNEVDDILIRLKQRMQSLSKLGPYSAPPALRDAVTSDEMDPTNVHHRFALESQRIAALSSRLSSYVDNLRTLAIMQPAFDQVVDHIHIRPPMVSKSCGVDQAGTSVRSDVIVLIWGCTHAEHGVSTLDFPGLCHVCTAGLCWYSRGPDLPAVSGALVQIAMAFQGPLRFHEYQANGVLTQHVMQQVPYASRAPLVVLFCNLGLRYEWGEELRFLMASYPSR